MREVSLLAPDSVVRRELARAYAPLVTTSLLRNWQSSPAEAPGREVSSPWPARIEIRSVEPQGSGCRVDGEIVYVTSADTSTAVDRRGVTIHVTEDDGWHVSAYTSSAPGRAGPATTGALDTSLASPASPSVDAGRDSRAAALADLQGRPSRAVMKDGVTATSFTRPADPATNDTPRG